MFKNKSLFFKLSFSILICTFLILGAVGLRNYFVSKALLMKKVEENARNLSASTAGKIDKVFISASEMAKNLAIFLENSNPDEKQCKKIMSELLKSNDKVFGTCAAYEPGAFRKGIKQYAPYCWKKNNKIKCSNLGIDSYQYFLKDWYQIPKEINRPVWMEPYFDEGGGDIIMSTYSVPFYKNANGKRIFKGIVTVDISLSWLQKLISSIKIIKNGYGFLISKNGTIVTHPDVSKIMNQTIFSIAEENNKPDLRKIGRKMISGESGFVAHKCLMFKRKCWLYYTPLKTTGWSLGVIFPETELFSPLAELTRNTILISALGLALLFSVIVYISHKITKPLRKLALATKAIGSGIFNAQLPVMNSEDEIGQLNKSFASMQEALAQYIANLKETTAAKERIESEINIAREIQLSIIPKLFPAFPDRDEFDIYAILESAKAVGGDLYDFFFIDEDYLYFAIGDVSGKGVPASLFMAVTQTLSRAKTDKDLNAGEIVSGINKDLCRDNDTSMFVTYFQCILNIKTGEMEYCNAGHNPPFIINQEGQIKKLENRHGLPMGVLDMDPYAFDKTILLPGDYIVLYTDGVTEAMNINNEEFGEERLVRLLENIQGKKNVKESTQLILDATREFAGEAEQSDDITILILKYKGT